MENAKIQVRMGEIEFLIEGEKDWAAAQLEKTIVGFERLSALRLATGKHKITAGAENLKEHSSNKSLATHLKATGSTTNQVKKLLATAVWLHEKGAARLSTADVAKALTDASQSALTNPAQCLNNNVGKGHCEKEGKQFYVTEEGRAALAAC